MEERPNGDPPRKERAIFIAVVLLIFGFAATAVAVSWDELSKRSESASPTNNESPANTPPPSPSGSPSPPPVEPDDLAIYSFAPGPLSCATPESDSERNEFEPGTTPEVALSPITRSVEELRELSFKERVKSRFLEEGDFESFIARKLDKSTPAAAETRAISEVFEMLQAIEPGTDLQEEIEKLYTDQISGIYFPNKERLLVSTSSSDLGPSEETVLAHELDHALSDQAIGLPPLGRLQRTDEDRAAAARALVEGEATLLQFQYIGSAMSPNRLTELQGEIQPDIPSVPYIVERSASFPYDEGSRFACHLFMDGGWDAINRAYKNPPTSSAEILFPYRYDRGIKPKDPQEPGSPGEGWKRTHESTFGAAELLWLFQSPEGTPVGSPQDNAGDVLAWNGGEYHVFEHDKTGEVAFYIGLVDGWTDVAPPKVKPTPLSTVMTEWSIQNWPDSLQKPAKGVFSGTTWKQDGTTYILATEGKQIGFAAAPSYKIAAALFSKT
jgi:hypothetical protein